MNLIQLFLLLFVAPLSYGMQSASLAELPTLNNKHDIIGKTTYTLEPQPDGGRKYIATLDEEVIGAIYYYQKIKSKKWYIKIIRTDPEYREKGIGSHLLAHCFQDLKNLNAGVVYWYVKSLDKNYITTKDLLEWYKKRVEEIQLHFAGNYYIKDENSVMPKIIFTFEKVSGEKS